MNKTFCVFPFFNLNTNTDGSVKLCCNIVENLHVKKDDGTDFNLGKDSIEEVWQSNYMNEVRKKMLLGQEVDVCKRCYHHEKVSGSSSRTESNLQYDDNDQVNKNIDLFFMGEELEPVSSLELRLGNVCNLKCNSCWGYSSSKVNQERKQMLKDPILDETFKQDWEIENNVPFDINKWYQTSTYKNSIDRLASTLQRIYLTGGEPTLIKENRHLLNKLIENNNTQCFVSFTTNGTIADSELLDLIKHFPNNEVQISVDGIGDKANYIRYPTDWNVIQDNINKILSLNNLKVVFYSVLSAYNLYAITEVLSYINELAATRQVGWYPIILENPSYMKTHVWNTNQRLEAVESINNLNLEHLYKYCSPETIKKVVDFYKSDAPAGSLEKFVSLNKSLDNFRNTSFTKTFPELSCLI